MDDSPTPLKFLVVAETSGYCDAETGLCISPDAEAEDSTPPPSATPEKPRDGDVTVR